MFKKTLLISLIATVLSIPSVANAQTYNKKATQELANALSEFVGGKKVILDLGTSEHNSKVTVKNGTCKDYMDVTVATDTIFQPSPQLAAQGDAMEIAKVDISKRIEMAVFRYSMKNNCLKK